MSVPDLPPAPGEPGRARGGPGASGGNRSGDPNRSGDRNRRSGRPGPRMRPLLRGFGLVGPRRDRHVLPVDQAPAFTVPVGDDGVVIGNDTLGQPAVLGLFRPSPFDVVLVGGLWFAQVLALRAAATGARVVVETGRGQAWQPMAQAAGGGMPCVTVHQVGQVAPQGPSVSGPVLVLRDCGARPPRSRLAAVPWQSVVTLLPYLGPTAPRLLASAGLVGVQRVSPDEAAIVGRVMGLPEQDVAALPQFGDEVSLWCTRRYRTLVATVATEAETGLLGPARRVDRRSRGNVTHP